MSHAYGCRVLMVVALLESAAFFVEASPGPGLNETNEDLLSHFFCHSAMHATQFPEYIYNMRPDYNAV